MIGFYGLTHLGLVSSVAAAARGFKIRGFDDRPDVISTLSKGNMPLHEPQLLELFRDHQELIQYSADVRVLSECDVVYISKDVPTDGQNKSDLSVITSAVEALSRVVKPDACVVILSQVSPGFSRRIKTRFPKMNLYYQVETLIFGQAIQRALYPERYIVGCENPLAPLPPDFRRLLEVSDCPILPMRYESAELAKISINCCLVASVSVANTLAEVCENVGADWSEITGALKLDKRIGPHSYLKPGLGLSGGNLERDLATVIEIAAEKGTDASVVKAWLYNSEHRRDWVLRTLNEFVFAHNPEAQVGIWGIAYKADTNSIKNSPSVALIESLGASRKVTAYDPEAKYESPTDWKHFSRKANAQAAAKDADVLVIMTPWSEFQKQDVALIKESMRGRTILDPFGCLNGDTYRENGFRYLTLGIGS